MGNHDEIRQGDFSYGIFQVYPTTIRTLGIGIASAWARVGAMLTPFVAQVSCPSIQLILIFMYTICLIIVNSIMYICTSCIYLTLKPNGGTI